MTDTPDSDQRPDDEPDVPTKKETAATAQSVASTDKDTSDDQPQDEGTPETAATDNPWRVDPAAWIEALTAAVPQLTRLAHLPSSNSNDEAFIESMRAFPVIGALIGLIGGIAFLAATVIDLPPVAAAALALGAILIVTRPPRTEALAALMGSEKPDDNAGDEFGALPAAGTVALILIVIVQAGILAEVGAHSVVDLIAMLIAAGAISRAVAVAALDWSTQQDLAQESGGQTAASYRATIEAAVVAVLIGFIALIGNLGALLMGVLASVLIGAAAGLLGPPAAVSRLRRGYAVIQQAAELGFIVIAAAALID